MRTQQVSLTLGPRVEDNKMSIGVAHYSLIVSGGVACNTATWRSTVHKEREPVGFEMNHPAAPIAISHDYVTSVCGKGCTCQPYASIWGPGKADNRAFLVHCWLSSPQGASFSFNEDLHHEMLLPYAEGICLWASKTSPASPTVLGDTDT